jgi:hypothetical protein
MSRLNLLAWLSFLPAIGLVIGVPTLLSGVVKKSWTAVAISAMGLTMQVALLALFISLPRMIPFVVSDILGERVTTQSLTSTRGQLLIYREETGSLPRTLYELQQFNRQPVFSEDAWGRPFVYRVEDVRTFRLFSKGRDGIEGTDDDIYP